MTTDDNIDRTSPEIVTSQSCRSVLREANLIGGKWAPARSGRRTTVRNPTTGEVIGHVPFAGREDAQIAIHSAYEAFRSFKETSAYRFETEDEVISLANDTEYGLAAYFYTKDLSRAFRVSEALEYGLIGVNEGLITTEVAPFGGMKESGIGREGSRYGIEEYLDLKYTCYGGIGPLQ